MALKWPVGVPGSSLNKTNICRLSGTTQGFSKSLKATPPANIDDMQDWTLSKLVWGLDFGVLVLVCSLGFGARGFGLRGLERRVAPLNFGSRILGLWFRGLAFGV